MVARLRRVGLVSLLLLAASSTAFATGACSTSDADSGERPPTSEPGTSGDAAASGADARAQTEGGATADVDTGASTNADGGPGSACADAGPFGGRTFVTKTTTFVIVAGGVYEDLIVTSPDSDSPAIEVSTTAPVVIRHVRGSGPGDFVHAAGGSDVTIENSVYVTTTATRDNVRRGRFYAAASPKNVVIEHCEMEHTSGIEVQSFGGDGSPAQTVRVRYCDAREIDGRFRNGGSEFQDFVGLSVGNRASAEISYNRIVTTPGQGRAEDNITMYKNGGTAARPYHVFRNYIEGSFPDAYLDDQTTGTAINADGDGSTSDADFPQYGIWEENVATGGAAINIAVGRHMRVNRNTVVSVGKNRFGTRYRSGNAGISFFNYIGSALYGDNSGEGNRVLWLSDGAPVTSGSAFSTTRRDVDQGGASLTNTVALTLPYATAEKTAYDDYMAMLATEGVSLGASWCK